MPAKIKTSTHWMCGLALVLLIGCAAAPTDNKSLAGMDARFHAIDTNGDGKISLQEWLDGGGDRLAFIAASKQEQGYLTADEFRTAMWHQGAAGFDMQQSLAQTDTALVTNVRTALTASSKVNAEMIKVEVYQQAVTLSGSVGSDQEKSAAENIATDIPGVKTVFNQLIIKP